MLSKIPDADRGKPTLDLGLENLPVERNLGVHWDVDRVAFFFKVREPHQPPTKRGIMLAIGSLYDPVGFVCPVVLKAKKILQRLVWDDLIPENLQSLWNKWKYELAVLLQVQVTRCQLIDSTVVDTSLHLFSDARRFLRHVLLSQICLYLWNCKIFFSRWEVEEFTNETNFDSKA